MYVCEDPVPTICRERAENAAQIILQKCNAAGQECFFGNTTYNLPSDPCALTANANLTRCSGIITSPPSFFRFMQPYFCVNYGPGFADARGNDESFICHHDTDGEYRYLFPRGSAFQMSVFPCAFRQSYCEGVSDPQNFGIWLYRWFLIGCGYLDGLAWKMGCNSVEWSPEGPAEQLVEKPFFLDLDASLFQPGFVHFVAEGEQPYCFPLQDQFCFAAQSQSDLWTCIGNLPQNQHPDRAEALNTLYPVLNLSYSEDTDPETGAFPFRNRYEITLKNCAWRLVGEIVDQLYQAHDPAAGYDSPALYTWHHEEEFDENNVTLSELGLEPYPPVVGVGPCEDHPAGLYPEYEGVAIPITCRARLTKVEYPAELTLKKVTVTLHLHVEAEGGGQGGYRVMGDAFVILILRIRLLPEAFAIEGPLLLRGRPEALNDRYNLEVEDPDDPYISAEHPGAAHPHEYLIPTGPNGERIWLQETWRGLLTTARFSRNDNMFVDITGASSSACCEALHAIDRCVIPAEINDCSELQADGTRVMKPQRYEGYIALGVDLNTVEGKCEA